VLCYSVRFRGFICSNENADSAYELSAGKNVIERAVQAYSSNPPATLTTLEFPSIHVALASVIAIEYHLCNSEYVTCCTWQLLDICFEIVGSFSIDVLSLSLSISFLLLPLWSIANPWNDLFHFRFLILRQSVGLSGRRISPSQGRYLYTEQDTHRINAHTDIHALSGIETHDPSVRASEGSPCHRDRHVLSTQNQTLRSWDLPRGDG
jgi:hypothetical protein